MSEPGPEEARDVSASDPNAGGPDGLAGGMGVSSERTGRVRGTPGEVSHGTEDTSTSDPDATPDTSPDPPDPLPR